MWIPIDDIDLYTNMRQGQLESISGGGLSTEQRRASIEEIKLEKKKKWYDYPLSIVRALF